MHHTFHIVLDTAFWTMAVEFALVALAHSRFNEAR